MSAFVLLRRRADILPPLEFFSVARRTVARHRRLRPGALLVAALAALPGCSSSQSAAPEPSGPAPAVSPTRGAPRRRPSMRPGSVKSRPPGDGRVKKPGEDASPGPPQGGGKDHGGRTDPPGSFGGASRRTDLRSDGDSFGETPGYSDITAAAIKGSERDLVFTLSVDGAIPTRMPDKDTSMTATFKLSTGRGEDDLHLTGDADGWTARFGDRSIDAFAIRGDRFIVSLPWSLVGGGRRFDWVAQSAWTSSSSGSTYYYFDDAPDQGTATFPES